MALRITPTEVLTAYDKTSLKPQQGNYFINDFSCACGLGAVFAYSRPNYKQVDYYNENCDVTEVVDTVYGEDYRAGFVHGFDDCNYSYLSYAYQDLDSPKRARYIDGLEDGKSAWEAVRHLSDGMRA